MPPLKQPKDLVSSCYSVLSQVAAKAIYDHRQDRNGLEALRKHFGEMPHGVLEGLYFWVIQASTALITYGLEKDDVHILNEHCRFLQVILQVLLHPDMTTIENDFTIDLRLLKNFDVLTHAEDEDDMMSVDEDEVGVVVDERSVNDLSELKAVTEPFVTFAHEFGGDGLHTFCPGLFVAGREDPNNVIEQRKFSLCWTDPRVVIGLVDRCHAIRVLNLEGYEELNDLVLEYIAGCTESNVASGGLINLEDVTLPKKSFVSEHGFRTLLEHLPKLEYIRHPGKMAQVFEEGLEPSSGSDHLQLKHFSQLESMTSGGVTDMEDWLSQDLSITPWNPSSQSLHRISQLCPHLNKISVLACDEHLAKIANVLQGARVEELEAHVTWSGISGLDLFAISFSQTLTKVDLTILEGYSWSIISAIGRYCPCLTSLHLTFWSEDITDEEYIDVDEDVAVRFANLLELKLKCEEAVDRLPEELLFYLLGRPRGQGLKAVQYSAPLYWLEEVHLGLLCASGALDLLEMFVLNNTSVRPMGLGLDALEELLETADNLSYVGNLRTWSRIDHYDPDSPQYFKCESRLSQLKRVAVEKNWDIDFDIEELEFSK